MYENLITCVALGVCAFTDLRWKKLPGFVIGIYGGLAAAGHFPDGKTAVGYLLAGMIPGLLILFIAWFSHQAIGYGDGLLLAACGMAVGTEQVLWLMFTAFFWAGIWAFIQLLFRKGDRKKEFPFAPFLFWGFLVQSFGTLFLQG